MVIRKSIIPILALIATAAVLFGAQSAQLVVTASGGRVIYRKPVAAGDSFDIVFTHSVARTPVVERFRVQADNTLLLHETIYQDFGAGLPSEADEGAQVHVGPEGIRIYNMSRVMPVISLRVGSTARHQLRCGEDLVELADLVEPGARVDISVKPHISFRRP